MCPQYLWIDTPQAYRRTTLKFRILMKKKFGWLEAFFSQKLYSVLDQKS